MKKSVENRRNGEMESPNIYAAPVKSGLFWKSFGMMEPLLGKFDELSMLHFAKGRFWGSSEIQCLAFHRDGIPVVRYFRVALQKFAVSEPKAVTFPQPIKLVGRSMPWKTGVYNRAARLGKMWQNKR